MKQSLVQCSKATLDQVLLRLPLATMTAKEPIPQQRCEIAWYVKKKLVAKEIYQRHTKHPQYFILPL